MKKSPLDFNQLKLALFFLLGGTSAFADVRLPALFSDHMVLQGGERLPVWGWAAPGEPVAVAIGGQTLATTADAQGNWQVQLEPLKTGAELILTVRAANTLTVRDVLVGEVWLGSGQSNMGLRVSGANDFAEEKARADLPDIRMFTVGSKASPKTLADCQGTWQVCRANTVGNFSAALYFFGRELHEHLNVPVGLIHSSWGGHADPAVDAFGCAASISRLCGLAGAQKAGSGGLAGTGKANSVGSQGLGNRGCGSEGGAHAGAG